MIDLDMYRKRTGNADGDARAAKMAGYPAQARLHNRKADPVKDVWRQKGKARPAKAGRA